MHRLKRLFSKRTKLIAGLMSGTSVDGIDAALVRVSGSGRSTRFETQAFITHPYPKGMKEHVLANSQPGAGTVDALCTLNMLLAHCFADAVKHLAQAAGVPLQAIDLIGSHGQTVHHLPERQKVFGKTIASTLQLGDPSVIAKLTGIVTIGDFRTGDMALGGQGAPLVPYFDYIAFRSARRGRALLNIGGIANLTILPKGCALEAVRAFDTGPGNMVIDQLMKRLFSRDYDRDGRTAASGKILPVLLDTLRRHPYFSLKPPKSTGREMFGEKFVAALLASAKSARPEDIVATATEFTAMTIYDQYRRFGERTSEKLDELIVSGGGARNPVLMDALHHYFYPARVTVIDDLGVSSDAKEAVCFAILANETLAGAAANVPAVTGASAPTVLGKICL